MIPTGLGSSVKGILALAPMQITAGDANDGVAQNGPAIDRLGYDSAVLVVPVSAALAEAATLTINARLQESADGSTGWVDIPGAVTSNLVLTGGVGGSTESGLLELNVNLRPCKRYVRAVITGDLSAATTDTQRFGAVLILGGSAVEPV